jgi:hypothetical protein
MAAMYSEVQMIAAVSDLKLKPNLVHSHSSTSTNSTGSIPSI